jgi:hypothetical protein
MNIFLLLVGIIVGALFHKPILKILGAAAMRLKGNKGGKRDEVGSDKY